MTTTTWNRGGRLLVGFWLAAIGYAGAAHAIQITLDYTLDEQNENWFDPDTPEGLSRRGAVGAAAEFLSTIITNDDWNPLPALNESITFSDILAPTIRGLNGQVLVGSPDPDGEGFAYTSSSNNVDITNRSSVAANEYVVYVGAFEFDDGTSANAKGGWDSSDRRNSAGFSRTEFNTWGGRIYFNTTKSWYTGSEPGIDPTDNFGIQDDDKTPAFDLSTDNWDWSTSSDSWKGFDLRTVDPLASGRRDLYATAMHELIHALGATSSIIRDFVGVNQDGDFIGPNLVEAFGGPVPGDGGHFEANVQSVVWGSEDIVSEVLLDPNSLAGVRKYFTEVDAALLRDIGYQVLDAFETEPLIGDFNGDRVVDASDYTVWRDQLGTATTLPGDNTPGAVTAADYSDWVAGYTSSRLGGQAIPEPVSSLPAITAFVAWSLRRGSASCRSGKTC